MSSKLRHVPFSLWEVWTGKKVTISVLTRQSDLPNHLRLRRARYEVSLSDVLTTIRTGKTVSCYGKVTS